MEQPQAEGIRESGGQIAQRARPARSGGGQGVLRRGEAGCGGARRGPCGRNHGEPAIPCGLHIPEPADTAERDR